MDEVSQIRDKIDIVAFIQEYIPLKKAGRNFKANCPFHNEKSPSFMVNPERQIYHCFGCGKGGDVYQFLMEYERLEFPEALRVLAKRAGIELTSRSSSSSVQTSKKEKIYQINKIANEFYHYLLVSHPVGKKAQAYLKNRGIDPKIIKTFSFGFAPGSGNALSKYLLEKKHFTPQDVFEAGLAARYGGRVRDFFRSRLITPLIDHRDNVVGFAGRILDDSSDVAKYINTRETLAYHKGQHVFGLNITKDAVRKANHVILCEGEFDVISCFQNGISNVAGVKGTALTEDQVNLLARFADKITFCFDADKAGQDAIKRSLPIVEKKGLASSIIDIPDAKDPDEALKKEPSLFKRAVRHDQPSYDYLLSKLVDQFDPETADGKKQITDSILPLIAGIKNEIIKEHYLKKTSNLLSTSYESIAKEIERIASGSKEDIIKRSISTPPKLPKEEILEEYLLSLIVQSDKPKKILEKAINILSDTLSKDRARQKILYHLLDHFERHDTFDGKKFISSLPPELHSSYDTSLLFPIPEFDDQQKLLAEVEKKSIELKKIYITQKRKQLAKEIKEKEQLGLEKEADDLRVKHSHLSALLK